MTHLIPFLLTLAGWLWLIWRLVKIGHEYRSHLAALQAGENSDPADHPHLENAQRFYAKRMNASDVVIFLMTFLLPIAITMLLFDREAISGCSEFALTPLSYPRFTAFAFVTMVTAYGGRLAFMKWIFDRSENSTSFFKHYMESWSWVDGLSLAVLLYLTGASIHGPSEEFTWCIENRAEVDDVV